MFVEREAGRGEQTLQERRDAAQNDKRILGHVIQCDGARARIAAFADTQDGTVTGIWTVGKMISINLTEARTVGLVYEINKADHLWSEDGRNAIEVSVELVGEIRDDRETGKPVFDRGITIYPYVGAVSHKIRARDLAAVYDLAGRHSVTVGLLSQDETINANIAIDDTLTRHFAVVGTTGVGKSSAVSLLLRKAIESRPDLRVLILDPHNEFASAFPDQSLRIDTNSLDLPFWMFQLEEFAEVLFRGRESVPEEIDLLRDLIPAAKNLYRNPNSGAYLRRGGDAITADTPVPYRMADLIKQIDERMGLLDSKNDRPVYRALKMRIEAALNDPRYRFMFNSRLIEDTIHETVGKIFRVPHHGRPVTCFEMAGLPSEVVNAVCSVLARLAFDLALWSNGKLRLLVMCEEAHRYMPSDPRLGFAPTRHALSRIAKEGRKYGCYLGVVTQRPGELDPTILSQCSTIFSMRLANHQDQAIIRSAIADSSASTLSFLSSMGQREAIAFGEGVATTMRLKFERLPAALIPGVNKHGDEKTPGDTTGDIDLVAIVERLRNVPKPQAQQSGIGELVSPVAQAGEPDYKKNEFGGSAPRGRRLGDGLY
ncbi:ATP-binding protein [Mesorhizobium sp. ZC-5]|uniref:ATP-binding protein n=1 Tax=Mesorhizobium sp. ZC-5 TaxID=2986066 RepID=UPI0021E8FD34|nr:ATP-binding protein [Mesorhizobium sp. ZC-5]MCV3241003.1 ATP-binding protein [Mesorhizobium sp. ZC-5]